MRSRSPGPPSATSGAQTAALVELYTSEGCDSCPRADRWLASTFRGNGEAARVIPLAFHVDYWDRLGWKDRFASAAYTDRAVARGTLLSDRPAIELVRSSGVPILCAIGQARKLQ